MNELIELLTIYEELGGDFIEVDSPAPAMELNSLNREIFKCNKCPLFKAKTNYVPGEGSVTPDIVFIGEGPGETEDKFGKPFIGKAGQLLEKIINKMGYKREEIFISNIVKCRPPNNRDPMKKEVEACLPYLRKQLEILKPKVIVCLGRVALNTLLNENYSISKVRGNIFNYMDVPLIPTYHPSYILHKKERSEISKVKWELWSDMEKVLKIVKGE